MAAKKTKSKKSNVQLIISALKTGKKLKSKDVSEMVDKEYGKFIKTQDVASMLSRVSNIKKSDLGYFVDKVPEGNTFAYQLFEEACDLSEEQIYGLTLKTGNAKYSLDQLVKDFPNLETYIKNPKKKPSKAAAKKKAAAKPAVKKAKAAKKAAKPAAAKKAAAKPAPKKAKAANKAVVKEVNISQEQDVFKKLESLSDKLKNIDGKDNMTIKDIDVKVSFTISASDD